MKAQLPKKKTITLQTLAEMIMGIIESSLFLQRARKREQDFTRKRKMKFSDLVRLIIIQFKCSSQKALEQYFAAKGVLKIFMKQQSFSDARKKIKWEAFQELYQASAQCFYSEEYVWNTWNGYSVFAIDGSKTQLPNEPMLLTAFGGMGAGANSPTAQASYLYDVLNDIIVDARITSLKTDERTLAKMHLKQLSLITNIEKKLIIFDRGYISMEMIKALRSYDCDFLFRVRTKFNVQLDALPLGIHDFELVDEKGESFKLTSVKLVLDTGEVETLLTSLKDETLNITDYKKLYFERWSIETKISELKHKIEIENFSGLTELTLFQDFYASVLLANMLAVSAHEAQPIIDISTDKANKYCYKVNKNHAIGVLKDNLIAAIIEPNERKRSKLFRKIIFLIAKSKIPIRPDRSIMRNPSPRKANFHHNYKSNA
jgi:hypothetical protein